MSKRRNSWLTSFPNKNKKRQSPVKMNGQICVRTGRTVIIRKGRGRNLHDVCISKKENFVCSGCSYYNLM